ncbi:hypothetical protein PA598K_04804 [Paenibacillus sp. 598K]|nr:hypothetical protein PA598K_04804 [Paenibacillus sp. 598K]
MIARATGLLLLFVSVYGLMSVFVDNLLVRSIKDVLMLLFAAVSILSIVQRGLAIGLSLLALIGGTVAIGAFGVLTGIDIVVWVYGVKITILPLLLLFLGMYIAPQIQRGGLDRIYLIVFLLAVGGWLTQYALGIERLMAMGFDYGVNIKHFADGMPRLPSIAFSPDNYAYLLAISGLLLERSRLLARHPWLRLAVMATTGVFLVLSTIRSALVLWLVSQLCLYLLKLRAAGQGGMLWLALLLLAGPTLGIGMLLLLQERDLLSLGSTLDRFSHWGDYLVSPLSLNGVVGFGLGAVGAASKRTVALGRESGSYAVDNQYLALYEQVGAAGMLLMLLLTTLLIARLLANLRHADSAAQYAARRGSQASRLEGRMQAVTQRSTRSTVRSAGSVRQTERAGSWQVGGLRQAERADGARRPGEAGAWRAGGMRKIEQAGGWRVDGVRHAGQIGVGRVDGVRQVERAGAWQAGGVRQKEQTGTWRVDGARQAELALALIVGGLFAGLTTNVLELFPYNVFLWLAIGGCLLRPEEYEIQGGEQRETRDYDQRALPDPVNHRRPARRDGGGADARRDAGARRDRQASIQLRPGRPSRRSPGAAAATYRGPATWSAKGPSVGATRAAASVAGPIAGQSVRSGSAGQATADRDDP